MKVAVVLSGCGVLDGSEIHESVLTLLALSCAQVNYQCVAPNIPQAQVMNHLTGKMMPGETRQVLVESARIARGDIIDIETANPNDYAAVFFPGGFGAAKNLSNFATEGQHSQIEPHVLTFAKAFAESKKPACYICISPALIPLIYGAGTQLTIGHDQATAHVLEAMGAEHIDCPVQECVVDKKHKLVTTPAYMLAQSLAQAAAGIEAAVEATLALIEPKSK